MRITAKVDYAVRAAVVLARTGADGSPVKGDHIGAEQDIPVHFLENILGGLRRAGLVRSQRGADGGYWLARSPDQISVADIIRAVEGPLASIRGERAEDLDYPEGTGALQELWIALRASIRSVLEEVTLAEVARGELPDPVRDLTTTPGAWKPH